LTGVERTLEIDCTADEMDVYLTGRYLVQDCFKYLSAEDREFIMTGTTPEEWSDAFKE
jgi:hypothetical protein